MTAPRQRRRLKRAAGEHIRQRCAELGNALYETELPLDTDTAIALIAMGLELMQDLGGSRAAVLKFCERAWDTPATEDPRKHTGGT